MGDLSRIKPFKDEFVTEGNDIIHPFLQKWFDILYQALSDPVTIRSLSVTTLDVTTLTAASIVIGGVTFRFPVGFGPITLSGASTSIITTIPSWARRIELTWDVISTNGTSSHIVQIGPSGGLVTAGYTGSGSRTSAADTNEAESNTNGFRIMVDSSAALVHSGWGTLKLHNSSTNNWVFTGGSGRTDAARTANFGGSLALSGALTQIAFSTVGGVNTWDGGTVSGTIYPY